MSIKFSLKIVEHFDDEAPETFGYELLDHVPAPGEVIQLHWLDGTEAHRVKVERVVDMTLHVIEEVATRHFVGQAGRAKD